MEQLHQLLQRHARQAQLHHRSVLRHLLVAGTRFHALEVGPVTQFRLRQRRVQKRPQVEARVPICQPFPQGLLASQADPLGLDAHSEKLALLAQLVQVPLGAPGLLQWARGNEQQHEDDQRHRHDAAHHRKLVAFFAAAPLGLTRVGLVALSAQTLPPLRARGAGPFLPRHDAKRRHTPVELESGIGIHVEQRRLP